MLDHMARMLVARAGARPALAEIIRQIRGRRGATGEPRLFIRAGFRRARRLRFVCVPAFLLWSAVASFSRAAASEPPAPAATPVIGLQQIGSSFGSITSITHAGDSRLFLTIQSGQIRVWSSGALLPTPFLDVSSLISCCGERGLLSVAFHPQYASNGFLYVYTTNTAGDLEITRYRRSASNANTADPTTRAVLLTIPHPTNANHNGGQLQFGPDGYLYIGTGDGGSGNDPPCNAQNDDSPLGKMLRIDVNQNVNVQPYYGIPPSNPMAAQAYPRNLAWSKGLRNPFRFSFDRSTGDLWIGDVGQSAREEVDFQPHTSAGAENYGWKIMEGTACGGGGNTNCPTNPAPPPCNSPLFTYPIYEYSHGTGDCAVIGGYVYRGTQDPAFVGSYLYGDLCTGRLWIGTTLQTPTLPGLQTFGEDLSGELYAGTGGGAFYRITHPNAAPTITSLAASPALPQNLGATITWTATATGGLAPLQYEFLLYTGATATWSVARAYSTSNTWAWTPAQTGQYAVQVWVRNNGSTNAYDAWTGSGFFNITAAGAPPTITSLAASPSLPQPPGTAITWTAMATGGLAPLQYQFVLYTGATATWSVARAYSTTNTWAWTPSQAGQYAVQVWVKNNGSVAPYDAWKGSGFFNIGTPGPPPTITSLTSSPTLPQPAGTMITWTAMATGGLAPLQYQFLLYAGATATWSVARAYSTSSTWSWTPSQAGPYAIQVWVKNSGSVAPYDAWKGSGFFNITP